MFSGDFRRGFVPLFALAALVGFEGVAQGEGVRSGLAATDLFTMADAAAKEQRSDDALALYNALTSDADPEVRAEARFRKGLLLSSLGQYADAAVAFRALLDEKPGAAPARLELARALALAGEEGAARRALRQAQAGGLPPNIAALVDQFAAALRSRKRVGGSLELALAPDSNINRATDARTLDTVIAPLILSEDARARSGTGLKLAGQVYARVPLGGAFWLVPRLSGRGDLYAESAFNDVSASGLAGVEWQQAKGRLSGSFGQTRRWYGRRPYASTTTFGLDGLRALGGARQIDASLSVARVRYDDNRLQDGIISNLEVGYEIALNERSGGRLSLSATRQSARDPGYATVSGGVSMLAWHEIWNSTIFATLGVTRLEGDRRLFLFPDRRREWLAQASVGATMRRLTIHGFAPVVRARVERNSSTVGIYDFQRIVFEGGLTRAF